MEREDAAAFLFFMAGIAVGAGAGNGLLGFFLAIALIVPAYILHRMPKTRDKEG